MIKVRGRSGIALDSKGECCVRAEEVTSVASPSHTRFSATELSSYPHWAIAQFQDPQLPNQEFMILVTLPSHSATHLYDPVLGCSKIFSSSPHPMYVHQMYPASDILPIPCTLNAKWHLGHAVLVYLVYM